MGFSSLLLAATLAAPPVAVAVMPDGQRASWTRGEDPVVLALPQPGEGWHRLAERLTGSSRHVTDLRSVNPRVVSPLRDVRVRVPWRILRGDLHVAAARALFPGGRRTDLGWEHTVAAPWPGEAESWLEIATIWCGDAARYRDVREANPDMGMFLRKGDVVAIPDALLTQPFRRVAVEGPARRTPVRPAPIPAPSPSPVVAATPAPLPTSPPRPTEPGPRPRQRVPPGSPLEYLDDAAVYRLRPGEALYSAVVVRFTGRLLAADVNAVAADLARRSGISDVTAIPVGFPVRIPFDLLLPEYLPLGHPHRQEWERGQAELAAITRAIRAANLEGIHIILDSGHGGSDPGAIVSGVWESTYAFDVMSRLKRVLERETKATVWVTVQDTRYRGGPPDRDRLPDGRTQRLLVDPPYGLADSQAGVHLRWILANSILSRLGRQKVSPERVAFVSIHADSLHPSVRGLMVYVPGRAQRSARTPSPRGLPNVREVRELQAASFPPSFRSRSEALSTQMANALVNASRRFAIPVHPFEPVRSSVFRGGSRWTPAVLRYNRVPTSVLVEVCNLNNNEDRAQLLTWQFRERLALALAAGLAEGFSR